jgi:hypothetical protein
MARKEKMVILKTERKLREAHFFLQHLQDQARVVSTNVEGVEFFLSAL